MWCLYPEPQNRDGEVPYGSCATFRDALDQCSADGLLGALLSTGSWGKDGAPMQCALPSKCFAIKAVLKKAGPTHRQLRRKLLEG